MPYDNPPARLHAVLTAGLAIDKNRPCRAVWAEVLGTPPDDSPALFSAMGKLMALPEETATLVTRLYPALASGHAHWRAPLESAFFNQQIGGKWESFIVHINPYCLSQLATFSELLHVRLGTTLAEGEEITKLCKSVDDLIDQVEAAAIEAGVKLHALRELMHLRATLAEYRITGSTPAIRQAEAIVGHMQRDQSFYDFMTDHDVGRRTLDVLNAIVGVLAIMTSIAQISAPGFTLIGR